jgi:enoyl-CoA hydratase/carnithine racemase
MWFLIVHHRNALSLAMLESIKLHLTQGVKDNDLRVIIMRAVGPVFSAGHDLKELVSMTKNFTACDQQPLCFTLIKIETVNSTSYVVNWIIFRYNLAL